MIIAREESQVIRYKQNAGEAFDEDRMLFCSINLKKMGREEDEERKPPNLTYYPVPSDIYYSRNWWETPRHDDDNGCDLRSWLCLVGLGLLLLHGR